MSGICAVWRKDNGPVGEILALVSGGLSPHRTEAVTARTDGGVGLAVSSAFATQRFHQDARVLVACDAELQNEKELQREAGSPDGGTAALLARLYERFGAGLFEKLRGAFSMVLWDSRERKLLASTDGFGIQRLAYYDDAKILLISSRADSIVRYGGVDAAINPKAVANILNFSSNLAPETIFRKVNRLTPGTTLMATDDAVRTEKYWDMRYGVGGAAGEERLGRQLEETVERAVRTNVGEGPFDEVGAYLSGGTDSSTVVGMMSRMARGQTKAFSIGFQEQAFDEMGYARIAAERFQAKHYTYFVGPDDCFEALPHIIRSFDEPYGNSSAVPTYFCARLAAQNGVKTLLAGDGGDELFGGNERYQTDQVFQVYQNVPRFLRKGLVEPALRLIPVQGGMFRRARNYIARSNRAPIDRYFSYQFLCTHPYEEVFEPDFVDALSGYTIADIPERYYTQAAARDHLDRLLYVDVKITLADNDLPKVTCMSELAGIRTRFPFLDRQVAEFSGCVPANLKVKGFEKRYLFKRAFRNLLPVEIIKKTKHGFGIPVALWLKTDRRLREMARDTLSSGRARSRGYFRRDFVEELFRKHETEDATYYGDTVWTFFVIELWHRQVVDALAGVSA